MRQAAESPVLGAGRGPELAEGVFRDGAGTRVHHRLQLRSRKRGWCFRSKTRNRGTILLEQANALAADASAGDMVDSEDRL